MKFLSRLLIIVALLCAGVVQAEWLGVRTVSDNLMFKLNAPDTLGRFVTAPDSFTVIVVHESTDDGDYAYYASGNTEVGWVSAVVGGNTDTTWYFRDAIADIDSAQGNGLYTGTVFSWYSGEQFPTDFAFDMATNNVAPLSTSVLAFLSAAFDGDSTTLGDLTLEHIWVKNTADSRPAVYIEDSTGTSALAIYSYINGGYGVDIYSDDGPGLSVYAAGSDAADDGIQINSDGATGIKVTGSTADIDADILTSAGSSLDALVTASLTYDVDIPTWLWNAAEVTHKAVGTMGEALSDTKAVTELTDVNVRTALGDSLSSTIIEVNAVMSFLGACDGCWYKLFPADGTASKDSVYLYDPGLGADSLTGRIKYFHNNVDAVYDSARFDRF